MNKLTTDAILKIILRMIPFFPAPEVYDLIRSMRRSEENLDGQILEAFASLKKSSTLIGSLGDLLKVREEKLLELQSEYQRISALSTLTGKQAEAVATSLEKAIGKSALRERVIAFSINIVAGLIIFVFGLLASDWMKILISHFVR
jgi:hypothetical protein